MAALPLREASQSGVAPNSFAAFAFAPATAAEDTLSVRTARSGISDVQGVWVMRPSVESPVEP